MLVIRFTKPYQENSGRLTIRFYRESPLQSLIGRQFNVGFAQGCYDLNLTTANFEKFGSVTSKSFNITTIQADNTSDKPGGVKSSINTSMEAEVVVTGYLMKADIAGISAQHKITKYFVDETQSRDGQPTGWLKFWSDTYPLGFYMFCNIIQGPGIDAKHRQIVTFKMTFKLTSTNSNIKAIQYFES